MYYEWFLPTGVLSLVFLPLSLFLFSVFMLYHAPTLTCSPVCFHSFLAFILALRLLFFLIFCFLCLLNQAVSHSFPFRFSSSCPNLSRGKAREIQKIHERRTRNGGEIRRGFCDVHYDARFRGGLAVKQTRTKGAGRQREGKLS